MGSKRAWQRTRCGAAARPGRSESFRNHIPFSADGAPGFRKQVAAECEHPFVAINRTRSPRPSVFPQSFEQGVRTTFKQILFVVVLSVERCATDVGPGL